MRHISTTPFGRRMISAVHLAHQTMAEAPAPAPVADKWALLRDLTEARAHFAVSDRDLAVLSALLTFHPGKSLDDGPALIVFPSNQSLSARAHGMPESTLRRHMAALVRAGLVLRHDSPNGKRYAMRDQDGQIDHAFGFDLRPLLIRADEITDAAHAARQTAQQLRNLRQLAVLRLRDASKLVLWLIETGTPRDIPVAERLAGLQRRLRRKLDMAELHRLIADTEEILRELSRLLPVNPELMSGDDSQNERHYQNSNPDIQESESCHETDPQTESSRTKVQEPPLELVLKAASEINIYAPSPIQSWRDLWQTACVLRPMLGIDQRLWSEACSRMGQSSAAIALACILERVQTIRSPGAYLRRLTEKARLGEFSTGPMVMALLNGKTHSA
ncbi:plasmid replication protein RepC [Paracoccus aestuariivivens]|uniref:Replication initiation protein RepC n=1 Tax=Paracoccus aestuariivivens TaxID=1820333 RepID=A0A6L6JAD3_9RHOB|nr:plasmid replication protein RepC [Paracoccus aestuariivivens]MTH78516.1 replication initiation protein RepC [Paracoccus aestuariivivens]